MSRHRRISCRFANRPKRKQRQANGDHRRWILLGRFAVKNGRHYDMREDCMKIGRYESVMFVTKRELRSRNVE